MSTVLKYPGGSALQHAISTRTDRTFAETIVATCQALAAGLSLSQRVEAARIWTDAAEAWLASKDECDGLGEVFAATVDSGLLEALPLLDADLLQRSCQAFDRIGQEIVFNLDDSDQAFAITDKLVERLPLYPSKSVAASISPPHASRAPTRTAKLGELLFKRATEPVDVAIAHWTQYKGDFIRRRLMLEFSSSNQERLSGLVEIDREFDEQFGPMYVSGDASLLGSMVKGIFRSMSKKAEAEKKWREEQMSHLRGKIMARGGMMGGHKYLKGFKEYLYGRVHAAYEEPLIAIGHFKNALSHGFDPFHTVCQLAFVLNFRNSHREARSLLEKWLPRFYFEASYDPEDTAVGLYLTAGGKLEQLSAPEDLPEVRKQAKENLTRRTQQAQEIAKKATSYRERLLSENGLKGLTLVDSVLQPEAVDAALSGDPSHTELVSLDHGQAAALCLDEVPLFVEADLTILARLAGDGVPAHEAAEYALALSESAEKRDDLDWKALEKLIPVHFRSERYVKRRIDRALDRGDRAAARDQLLHFKKAEVLTEETAHGVFGILQKQYEKANEHESMASLGEELLPLFKGPLREEIAVSTVKALLHLADHGASLGNQVALLKRATAVQPNNAELAARFESTRKARNKRNLIIAGIVLLLAAIGAGVFFLTNQG